jgi:hypothetical protein
MAFALAWSMAPQGGPRSAPADRRLPAASLRAAGPRYGSALSALQVASALLPV